MKVPFVLLFHFLIHSIRILERRFFQDSGQRSAGVLGININSSRQHGLLADIGAGKIEAAFNFQLGSGLDLLRDQFAQDKLFGKILGAYDDNVLPRRAAGRECEPQRNRSHENAVHAGRKRFSSSARPKSASKARTAAGTAPARITTLFTMARPRKMNSPRPPAPMAAAMVASPTEITVATRTPAMITLRASGSSTCHKSCRPVMPMPRPASTTARSTPMMPT